MFKHISNSDWFNKELKQLKNLKDLPLEQGLKHLHIVRKLYHSPSRYLIPLEQGLIMIKTKRKYKIIN